MRGGVPALLSQLSVSAGLHGRHPGRSEAAVLSVRARVLLPDSLHAAAGDGRVGVDRWDPKPPADVLTVGTVTQGAGLASHSGWTQRVPEQEDGLQQGATQHKLLEQRRRGDAGAVALPAAQRLLGEGRGSAAVTLTPGWAPRFGVGVRFMVEGRRSVVSHAVTRLEQTEDGPQVSRVLLSGQEYIKSQVNDKIHPGCNSTFYTIRFT